MNKIVGDIATEPDADGGNLSFYVWRQDTGSKLRCVSAPGFQLETAVIKKGSKVVLYGDSPAAANEAAQRFPIFFFRQLEVFKTGG